DPSQPQPFLGDSCFEGFGAAQDLYLSSSGKISPEYCLLLACDGASRFGLLSSVASLIGISDLGYLDLCHSMLVVQLLVTTAAEMFVLPPLQQHLTFVLFRRWVC
ncbi:unnamed protein product, partial [Arabidopsis halleri]